MPPKLIIHINSDIRRQNIDYTIEQYNINLHHPDLLYFAADEKLGVAEAKKIRLHLSLKPYQAPLKVVALVSAHNLTIDAQNALLKALEEPPEQALIILGASSEDTLLPTVVSRCEVIRLSKTSEDENLKKYYPQISQLLSMNAGQRFKFIEMLDKKEEFLMALTAYFRHQNLASSHWVKFLKDLIKAQKWTRQNVNIRATLEYLMLKMP